MMMMHCRGYTSQQDKQILSGYGDGLAYKHAFCIGCVVKVHPS
jgi:hypothetical protein